VVSIAGHSETHYDLNHTFGSFDPPAAASTIVARLYMYLYGYKVISVVFAGP